MIASQLPVAVAAIVTVVVDGATAPVAPPARLAAGRVVVPAAFVAHIADRTSLTADALDATRGERACAVRLLAGETVVLAPLARCLGAAVAWDTRTKTLALAFPPRTAVDTHPTYDPNAPRVAPTTIFTPEPPRPTPRTVETGVPLPRRTALPETPSGPLTSPRPRAL